MLTVFLTLPICLSGQQRRHTPRISSSVPFTYPTHDVVGRHLEYSVATAVDFANATVFAYTTKGEKLFEVKIKIPGALRANIHDVAVSPTRQIVVAATATNETGSPAAFLLWLSARGSVERMVRTSPFAAASLVFAVDGTLWAAGREHTRSFDDAPGHNVIRKYGSDGMLIKSMVPVESFSGYRPPTKHPALQSYFVANSQRVALYSETTRELIALATNGALIGRWQGPDIAAGRVTGVAIAPSGTICVSTPPNNSTVTYYCIDEASGDWHAIPMQPNVGELIGSVATALVAHSRTSGLQWIELE